MLAEHQQEAVRRILELLPRRGGALLADEAGLGKSFVAAEVIRRLGIEAELVVPAALQQQWRETLRRFGVAAQIVTHDGLAGTGACRSGGPRLLVVDEAHAFRNPQTLRYRALADRGVGARLLLVTATPLCNSLRDLEALLRLFARDDVLSDRGVPSIDAAFARHDPLLLQQIVSELVIRRTREVLPPLLHFGELQRRVIRHPVPAAPEIDSLAFPLVGETALLRRFLRRRLESSEAALIESVRRQLRFYSRVRSAIASGRVLPKREYRRAFAGEEDGEQFQEILFWELFAPAGDVDVSAIERETRLLDSLLARMLASSCEKRSLLIDLAAPEREPMLVFTGSAATANDLHEALVSVRRCGLITARERSREAVLRAFAAGAIDVIVSTDTTAEGLNLQRAGVVVHYDIPWNPVRLDQRNGRAFRIGQHRPEVRAVYFLPDDRTTRIVETVTRKKRLRRQTIDGGGLVVPVRPCTTIRPRVTTQSAIARFLAACGGSPPEPLVRRHKAGIERMIEEAARSGSREAVERLLELVSQEV